MSLKSEWKKVEAWWKGVWGAWKNGGVKAAAEAARSVGGGTAGGLPNPSLASCWEGKNAARRHMNELSGKMGDADVEARLDWAKGRGCNTVHWFLVNQGDGEGAGYSIYGGEPTLGRVDEGAVARMARRCEMARKRGLSVVFWLLADDSAKWNKAILGNPGQFAADLAATGLLKHASAVVLGLEMDEYMGSGQAAALASAVRGVWSGTLGTHHTSGKGTFAGLGDVVFWQLEPGKSAAQVASATASAKKATGKPVVMFEIAREPARGLCEAAIGAGAAGCGNW